LQDLAAKLKAAAPCLNKEVEAIVDNVYDTLQKVEDVEDLDVVDRASAALARMDPENVSSNHILTPIVNVAAFRAAVRQALGMVESKRKYLGKTRSVHLAQKSLSDFNMAEINVNAVQTFKSLFVRSIQYVATLKSKDHQDVKNFRSLIGCMLDKAAEGIKEVDQMIGRCIARESGDDEANLRITKSAVDRLCKFFDTLGFQEAVLKEVADAYNSWQRSKDSCEKRRDIMTTVQKLVEKQCVEVQVSSELKFQAKELAVPLDELALLAIETCAQDSSVKSGAEMGRADLFRTK